MGGWALGVELLASWRDRGKGAAEDESAAGQPEPDPAKATDVEWEELRVAVLSLTAENASLRRQNAELEEFAAVASHDLKEPLRGIHNYASFVLEDAADRLDAESVRRLETVRRLAQRSEAQIEAVLRMWGGGRLSRTEPAPVRVGLGACVREVAERLGPFLRECGVGEVEIDPLPDVVADPVWLRELLSELLKNAAIFSDRPERRVRVGSAGLQDAKGGEGGRTVVYVEDDGIGIPERHRETVFRMFKRLHPRDRYGGGVGAGLAVCRRIVERHGGTIWIEEGGIEKGGNGGNGKGGRDSGGGGARVCFTLEGAG